MLQASGAYSGVSVSNEMLVFSTDAKVDEVISSIQELESELRTYLNNLYGNDYPDLARYNAIMDPNGPFEGRNPISGTDIGAYTGHEIEKIDDDPIKYMFEEAFSFDGLRRYLVDEEYQLVDDGTFNGAGNDPDDHFIPDDYLRLILNDKLEIKVASKVYKIVSSTSILEMDAPTMEQITAIRAEFAPPLSYTEVTEQPNPGVCYGNPTVQSYNNIVVVDFQEPLAAQSCAASFTYVVDQVLLTQVAFTNTSTGTYGSLSWNFGDGNVSTSPNPTHTYSQNGTYYVTLTLNDGVNVCDAVTEIVEISSGCVADFDAVVSNSNQLMVDFTDLSRSNNSGATVVDWNWDYGDGSTIVTGLANPTHTYSTSGIYQVCLVITTSDNCTENHCENVTVSSTCCKTNKTEIVDDDSNPNDKNRPILVSNNRYYKGKVWITSLYPFYRRIGAKTKCYRQKNNGNFEKEKADYIYVDYVGNVRNNDCSQSAPVSQPADEYDKKTVTVSYGFSFAIKLSQNDITALFTFEDNGAMNWQGTTPFLTSSDCP